MFIFNFLAENDYQLVAGVTGLEPATSCVTGRRSNQLSYTPTVKNLMVGGKGLEPMTLSV
jgi:hypothetical protein